MPLSARLRASVPDSMRHDPRLRAVALATGLIPPRTMHTADEARLFTRLAGESRCVVELGVYEGSSAIVIADALPATAELHLVDPFVDETGAALPAGWRGVPAASRAAVRRHTRRAGRPRIVWHVARSQDLGRRWGGPDPDLVFIDGDHSVAGCREDWEVWHPHVAPGGRVAFHDAREGSAGGFGSPGPTQVVAELLRDGPPGGWGVDAEVGSIVVLRRDGGRDGGR